MKQIPTIEVTQRETMTKGQKRELRASGIIPGSISSRGEDSVDISVNRNELMKLLSEHGKSGVLQLNLGAASYNVMVREMQVEPLTYNCIHVNFQHISMDEETKANVLVRVQGEDAISQKGYESLQQLDTLPVTGLPNDIPSEITFDVSHMEAGDTLFLRDITLPEGIKTDMEEDRVVFTVSYPRAEEVEEEEKEATSAEVPLVGSEDEKPEA